MRKDFQEDSKIQRFIKITTRSVRDSDSLRTPRSMHIIYWYRKVNGLINGGICTNEAPILEDIKVLTAVKDDSKSKIKGEDDC